MTLDSIFFMDSEFFKVERTQSVTLRGSLYLTLFGNPQSQTVVLTHKPANVGNGIQCSLNEIGQLVCRSAFRWPRLFVYAKVRNDIESLWPMISYSPFPAGLELNYIEEHWAGGPPPHAPEATIIMKQPLAHLRKDFELADFQLESFAPGYQNKN